MCSILKCARVTALNRQPALPGTLEMCRPGVWNRQAGTPPLREGVDLPSEPVPACLLPCLWTCYQWPTRRPGGAAGSGPQRGNNKAKSLNPSEHAEKPYKKTPRENVCCVWLLLLVMAVGEEGLKQALWGGPGAVLEQFPLSEEVGFWVGGDGTLRKAASFPGKVYSPTYFHLYLHIFPK